MVCPYCHRMESAQHYPLIGVHLAMHIAAKHPEHLSTWDVHPHGEVSTPIQDTPGRLSTAPQDTPHGEVSPPPDTPQEPSTPSTPINVCLGCETKVDGPMEFFEGTKNYEAGHYCKKCIRDLKEEQAACGKKKNLAAEKPSPPEEPAPKKEKPSKKSKKLPKKLPKKPSKPPVWFNDLARCQGCGTSDPTFRIKNPDGSLADEKLCGKCRQKAIALMTKKNISKGRLLSVLRLPNIRRKQ